MVSGYVKCPRCHAVLPGSGRFRRSGDAGGTSVERGFPIVPVAVGVVAVAVVLVLVLGGATKKKEAAPATPPAGETSEPAAPAGVVPPNTAPPAATVQRTLEIPSASGPDPRAAAGELERALGRQRLWSSVQAAGDRVEIRSGSCGDPGMGPAIDAARTGLRGAGLTRLRCLAQSGAVVFERDL